MATIVSEKKVTCCSCEQDMKEEVNELVENVEGYTPADRRKKMTELDAAFGTKDKKKTTAKKTTATAKKQKTEK